MTPLHCTELVIRAMDRARLIQRSLAAVRGVVRFEPDVQPRGIPAIRELAGPG